MGDSPRFTLYPSQQSIYHLKIMVYRIPFTLKFHPHNHAVKFVILKTLNYFKMTLILAEFFSQTPLISFQRHKHIGNLLVRSAFQTSDQLGTFKCARARCKTGMSFHSRHRENIGIRTQAIHQDL